LLLRSTVTKKVVNCLAVLLLKTDKIRNIWFTTGESGPENF
jgi:hypothetical protein